MDSKLLNVTTYKSKGTVTLSEAAATKIRELASRQSEGKGKYLRLHVQGGGCSGYLYGFKFDDKRADDHIIEKSGATCLVDPQSMVYLKGSVIDYADGLTGAGFVVKNPNATGSCGCGKSFSTS